MPQLRFMSAPSKQVFEDVDNLPRENVCAEFEPDDEEKESLQFESAAVSKMEEIVAD